MGVSKVQVHVGTKDGPVGEVTRHSGRREIPPTPTSRSFSLPVPGHICGSDGNIDKYYSILRCDAV
jgi:hypothetical protein